MNKISCPSLSVCHTVTPGVGVWFWTRSRSRSPGFFMAGVGVGVRSPKFSDPGVGVGVGVPQKNQDSASLLVLRSQFSSRWSARQAKVPLSRLSVCGSRGRLNNTDRPTTWVSSVVCLLCWVFSLAKIEKGARDPILKKCSSTYMKQCNHGLDWPYDKQHFKSVQWFGPKSFIWLTTDQPWCYNIIT